MEKPANVFPVHFFPKNEMKITALQAGWAEQHPDLWWENLKLALSEVMQNAKVPASEIDSIGISYQMHGLVVVDKNQQVLRPSIIWCDSRAAAIGDKAFQEIGAEKCLSNLLNSPGNFTASKLKWVKDNEPELYSKIDKIMLPGDYIAMKLTGEIKTTASGLSEGIMWDFQKNGIASLLLDYYGFDSSFIPEIVPTFSVQGEVTKQAAEELGLAPGIKISYRAGDQPNNALSLNVLNPGEIATYRRNFGSCLRRERRSEIRPAFEGEYLCPRKPFGKSQPFGRFALHQRNRNPELMAA